MHRSMICLCIFLLEAAPSAFSIQTAGAPSNLKYASDAEILDSLVSLQDKYFRILTAFDVYADACCSYYPIPDWMLRMDAAMRNSHYEELHSLWGPSIANTKERKFQEKRTQCFHYDTLCMLPRGEEQFTTDTLHEFRSGTLQRDPFSSGSLIGYYSTIRDCCLVSCGPDGHYDLMGFRQLSNGDYWIEGEKEPADDFRKIEALGLSLISHSRPQNSNYELWTPSFGFWPRDPRDLNSTLRVDPDLLYDPTNGLASSGDIVFQRRQKHHFMFEDYLWWKDLTSETLIKKDLRKTLTSSP